MTTISSSQKYQSQLPRQASSTSQSDQMPPSSPGSHKYNIHHSTSTHTASGYTMALAPRHDRVDYSIVKGGLRLWVVIFAFCMLLSAMIAIFSNNRESIQIEIDNDDEFDDIVVDEDIVQTKMNEMKHDQEGIDGLVPDQPVLQDEPKKKRRRPKETEEKIKEEIPPKDKKRPMKEVPEKEEEVPEKEEGMHKKNEKESWKEKEKIPQVDEETLLGRLWEKMKSVAEQKKEEKEEPKPTVKKSRKRGHQATETVSTKEPVVEISDDTRAGTVRDEEDIDGDTTSEETGTSEVGKSEPLTPPASDQVVQQKTKVRVFRVKGKPAGTPIAISQREKDTIPEEEVEVEVEVEAEAEAEAEAKQREEDDDQKKKKRTKKKEDKKEQGNEKERRERREKEQKEEEKKKAEETQKKIPIRVTRRKGLPKLEDTPKVEHDIVADEDDQVAATQESGSALDEKSGEKTEEQKSEGMMEEQKKEQKSKGKMEEKNCGKEVEKPTKPTIKVKYVKIRGKKKDEDIDQVEEKRSREVVESELNEEEEEKPKIPVRVYRTKGVKSEIEEEDREEGKLIALKQEYRKRDITNREDNKIRQLLDSADRLTEERRLEEALAAFDKILSVYPKSARAHYGRAKTLESMADDDQSNSHLEACIHEYEAVLRCPHLPEPLQRLATDHLVDRARFRGWFDKAATAQRRLIDKHPDDLELLNQYGVTYLMIGRHEDAKKIFENVLSKDPKNGFASAYYGFILKTVDGDYENAIEYMHRGIESTEDELDARLYFHLGDALQRLNRTEEAYDLYEQAAEVGIFLSKYQRSLYNAPGLKAQPFWTPEETSYMKELRAIESEWKTIRDEALALIEKDTFRKDPENLTIYGDMKEFVLYSKGTRLESNCAKAAKTCNILTRFPAAVKCTRCEVKFSLMVSGTRVWPHCGPTNCRLQGHLGLVVPPEARVRVGEETRSWRQGKFVILDDSFEHEYWHDGTGFVTVLVVGFWHPDLSLQQRVSLTPI